MAERRMFTKKITESDAFLDMPLSSQCLYFHLNMAADDDGFINNPKRIMRLIGASEDDLNLLVMKSFVITFDSGVIVIKHWKMHNYLRCDRYKPTDYTEEKSMLGLKENKAYTLDESKMVDTRYPIGIPTVDVGKDRLGKDSKGNKERVKRFTPPTLEEVKAYCKERGNKVSAEQFFSYYEAGNWKDSKGNPVRNWKQKLLTWERHETPKQQKFDGLMKQNYDIADIEKKLLGL